MIAGSSPIFFARRGRIHRYTFAIITTAIIVIPRATASIMLRSYIIQILTPFTNARSSDNKRHSDLFKDNFKNIRKLNFADRKTSNNQSLSFEIRSFLLSHQHRDKCDQDRHRSHRLLIISQYFACDRCRKHQHQPRRTVFRLLENGCFKNKNLHLV